MAVRRKPRIEPQENGRISIKFDYDHVFKITASKEGHQSKSLILSTSFVPWDEREWGYEFAGFTVDLIPMNDSIAPEAIVTLIYYDSTQNNFAHRLLDRSNDSVGRAVYHQAVGLSLSDRDLPRKAISAFTKSLELDPDNPATLIKRASCYERLNMMKQACMDCQKAQSLGEEVPRKIINRCK